LVFDKYVLRPISLLMDLFLTWGWYAPCLFLGTALRENAKALAESRGRSADGGTVSIFFLSVYPATFLAVWCPRPGHVCQDHGRGLIHLLRSRVLPFFRHTSRGRSVVHSGNVWIAGTRSSNARWMRKPPRNGSRRLAASHRKKLTFVSGRRFSDAANSTGGGKKPL